MSSQTSERILVLRYRFIGDTILTVPFLRNLRNAHPDAYIAWVITPGTMEVVSGIPYVDELIFWDPVTIHADSRGTHKTWRDKLGFIMELRAKKFNKVYVLKRSLSSAIMAFLSGAGKRVGFATEGRGFLLTTRVPYNSGQHEVQNFLDVLRADKVPVKDDYLESWLTDDELDFAERFYQDAGVSPGETLIGIHPFAANPPRSWHLDNFKELANKLQQQYDCRIVFFGGPRDAAVVEELISAVTPKPVIAVGGTTLRQSMALIRRLKLMICNDSGIMHLAASLRTPLVAIYGPQSPDKFGPWGEMSRIVYRGMPCSPCRQKFFTECQPSDRGRPECLESITVDEVFSAAASLMDAQRGS